MIKVEKIDVWGWEHAIRGMRNPLNSWDKSDSQFYMSDIGCELETLGKNDLELMQKLYKAGAEHRKYLRQIFVSMDITAPLYWWKEFDTYKFVVPDPAHIESNSCSTMHKIAAKEFELDDFSHEYLFGDFEPIERKSATEYEVIFNTNRVLLKSDTMLMCLIEVLNFYREKYLETKDKQYWWQLIQLLPSSYNQRRTITMSYETVITMIQQRTGHKLDEWNEFVRILDLLPYVHEIRGGQNE